MENFDASSEEIELNAIIGEIEDYLDEQEEIGNKFIEDAKRNLRRGICILNISSCLRKAVVIVGIKVKCEDDKKSYIKFLKNYITNIKKNKGENAHVSD